MASFIVPPATDPAYLAFLRSTGVQEQDLGAEAAMRISALNRAMARHAGGYADEMSQGLQNTADQYENNGLFRSGGRLVAQQNVANDVNRRQLEEGANTADQAAGINYDTAQQVADLQRQAAERDLATREQIGNQAPPLTNPSAPANPSDVARWNAAVAANAARRTQDQWNDPRYK